MVLAPPPPAVRTVSIGGAASKEAGSPQPPGQFSLKEHTMRHAHELTHGLRHAAFAISAAVLMLFSLTGCPEGKAEKVGKHIDDATEDVKDTAEDVVDETEDVIDSANESKPQGDSQ
jgi:hypothetical protein